jgi:hypothetical protein
MSRHSREYSRAITSKHWYSLKAQRILETQWRCERCGRRAHRFELHHKTYDRLGRERHGDVELLCPDCHPVADNERRGAA